MNVQFLLNQSLAGTGPLYRVSNPRLILPFEAGLD